VLYVEHKFIEPAFGKVVDFPTFLMENTNLSSNTLPVEYHNILPYICTVPVDE
jgi:hypothetical protein